MAEMTGTTSDGTGGPSGRDRKRDIRLVATGIGAGLLIWFAVANLQNVEIHFWVATTKAPLIVVIVIAGLLGAAVATLAGYRRRRGRDS